MNPVIRNILAVLAGLVVGNIVNMGIITVGPEIVPPPEGVNPADVKSIKENIHLYTPLHLLVPFLAHAFGTLVGALITCKIAISNHLILAIIIGLFFLVGGIMVNLMIGGPTWFTIVDLVFAYIPMAYLGYKLGIKRKFKASLTNQ